MMVALSLPPTGDPRLQQPVGISSCGETRGALKVKAESCVISNERTPLFSYLGTLVGLKGGILTMALLDAAGALLPPTYEPWYDPNTSDEEKEKSRRRRPASPPSSQEGQDCQFAVLCSEKQAKVVAMPSQTRVHKHNITEASFVLRADVVQLAGTNCIACFCANGHIMTLRYPLLLPLSPMERYLLLPVRSRMSLCRSLPSLRPLLDVNYLPLTDMRIARTFCFSNVGQAMYMTSPTEIQRVTYSQETCDNLQVNAEYSKTAASIC